MLIAMFLLVGTIAALIIIGFYTWRIRKAFRFKTGELTRRQRWISIILAVAIAIGCVNVWTSAAMLVLTFTVCIILSDLAGAVIRLVAKKNLQVFVYGIPGVLAAICLLAYGAWNMTQVRQTEYTVSSAKLDQSYDVVLITDTHYDTIQSTEILKGKIEEINELKPDIVILGGDIVEEDTSGESMREAFSVLGELEARYGVYYVFGNHDRQNYRQDKTYTIDELEQEIEGNGITILKDTFVNIGDDLILAGRDDAAWGNTSGRASISDVLKDADHSKFLLTADHQPIEHDEEEKAGVDLVVSGHTHGGQIFPIGIISELTGTLNYGTYFFGNTEFIVSSGFTGWGYPIRTEEHCEYVRIHLTAEN